MEIILITDVKKLGFKYDIVKVSDGYGRNYLIANKLGILKDAKNLSWRDKQIKKINLAKTEKEVELNKIKKQIEDIELSFTLHMIDNKVSKSISSKKIVLELQKKHNLNLDHKQFVNFKNLNKLGRYKILIKLGYDIKANLKINISKD